jgi:hypothetical protein
MKKAIPISEPKIGDLVMFSPKMPILGWVQNIFTKQKLEYSYDVYYVEWFPDEQQAIKYFGEPIRRAAESYGERNITVMKEYLKDYLK